MLGILLKDILDSQHENKISYKMSSVVIGIPRGGMITAYGVSTVLGLPLQVLISSRLTLPQNNEITIGALMLDNPEVLFEGDIACLDCDNINKTTYLLEDIIKKYNVSDDYITRAKKKCLNNTINKHLIYQIRKMPSIFGKQVILVDDGVYSGATSIIALRWIRKQNPNKIIFVTPVAPVEIAQLLKEDEQIKLDRIESIFTVPYEKFGFVDKYYSKFDEVDDDMIKKLLKDTLKHN
jgi:predicted phosphoribosyltransferase